MIVSLLNFILFSPLSFYSWTQVVMHKSGGYSTCKDLKSLLEISPYTVNDEVQLKT